jgi:hypothetical protein
MIAQAASRSLPLTASLLVVWIHVARQGAILTGEQLSGEPSAFPDMMR